MPDLRFREASIVHDVLLERGAFGTKRTAIGKGRFRGIFALAIARTTMPRRG